MSKFHQLILMSFEKNFKDKKDKKLKGLVYSEYGLSAKYSND